MKLLINDKEIANFITYISRGVLSPSELKEISEIEYLDTELSEVIYFVTEKKQAGRIQKFKKKIPGKLHRAIRNDLNNYLEKIKEILVKSKDRKIKIIRKNLDYFLEKIGEENLFETYKKIPAATGFIKSVGLSINPKAEMELRSKYVPSTEDCLMRNTVGNENILVNKIDNSYPFWFIDSGYTNFLEGKNKVWHRLTRNHIHHTNVFLPPTNRLGVFKEFPKPWREDGEFILVIEPGPFSAAIFHIDLKNWKYNIEQEIRKYSDKPIKFRPKINKKVRSPLYQELLNEDYYCLININSNAATEAIWAGVPVITLDQHISNSVSRRTVADINNLHRPHLANWLTMLSYCQFTYEELTNGTAVKIAKQFYV